MARKAVEALVLQGQKYASQGELQRALQAYEEAVSACRQAGDSRRLAELFHQIGRNLMGAFFELATQPPGAFSFQEFERRVELQEQALNYPDSAVEYFRQAVNIDPDRAEFQGSLGEACHEAGRRDDAIAACRRALELRPSWHEVQALLASVLLGSRTNEPSEEAIHLLKQAAAARPDDLDIRRRLLDALALAHRADETVREFVELVRAWPEWTQIHYDVANRCAHIAPAGVLRQAFQRAAAAAPSRASTHYYGLGLVCQSESDQEAAIRAYKAGIELDPHFAPLPYNLGNALRANDQREESIPWFEKSVALSDTLAEPHFALGVHYLTSNRAKAQAHLRAFLDRAPPHLAAAVGHARLALKAIGD
jgi:tetratricopeptide (TPR) repeat protein